MLVWGAVGLLVAAAVVEWLVWNIRRIRRGVPGYWGWPVFYSLPAIIGHIYRDDLLQDLLKLAADKKYSWNFRAPGYGDVVVSGKPDDVAWILQGNFENYPKYEAISDLAQELFGGGIFAVNGDEWKLQRRVASNSFRVRDIKQSVSVFHQVAQELGEVLERRGGAATDIQPLMQNATLAAFTSLSFGQRLAEVQERETEFAVHFNRLTSSALSRIANPLWRLMPWLPSERAIRESARFIDALADRVIASSAGKETLLSPFFELEMEQARKQRLLRDVLVNFLVAGRDTTSVTLSSALHFLAENPAVQARLHDEISAAMGDAQSEPDMAQHLEGRLPFLSAVLKETMRLAPAVPIDPKVALHDDVLPSGLRIKAGQVVEWHQWIMSRDPAIWGADAEQFRPERWLEGDERLPTTNRPPWCPFQFGPRTCLGMRMAICDMETVLVHLVHRFRFESAGHAPHYINLITLCSRNGFVLRAVKR